MGIEMMSKDELDKMGLSKNSVSSMGAGGDGGGMGVVSGIFKVAQQIGDVNQTAQNQKGRTSFSWVADPAGTMYQQRIFKKRFPGDQLEEDIQKDQRKIIQEQGRGLKLANDEEQRKQKWNSDFRRYLYGGRV